METNFNFKSQICTDRFQSERLLALGLKKETADMCHFWHWESDDYSRVCASWEFAHRSNKDIPAWSLHRLIEIMGANNIQHWLGLNVERDFDLIIDTIEELIKEGYFKKEYLV